MGGIRQQQHPAEDRRHHQSAPLQAPAQLVATALQPSLHGTRRTIQALRCLVLRQPLQATKNDRGAVVLRQVVQFLIEDDEQLARAEFVERRRWRRATAVRLALYSPPSRVPCPQGEAKGDAMQPARQRFGTANRRRPAGQHQERGLEHVLGRLPILNDTARQAQHHRPVAVQQRSEGIAIARADKLSQQLPVVLGRAAPPRQEGAQMIQHHMGSRSHGGILLDE